MNDGKNDKPGALSIDHVMRRLFVGPFYRQHAGTFLFLYVLFIGSFLFINYLGEIPASESFFWHFVLMIFMVTHQFMVVLFLTLACFYLVKTRLFIKELLTRAHFAFLQQSIATLSGTKQLWIWLKVQLWLSLPLLIYGLACLAMSLFKGLPVYGIVIMAFLFTGVVIATSLHARQLLRLPSERHYRLAIRWQPQFNLTRWMVFIYSVSREFLALMITKGATILLTLLMIHWQREGEMSARQWWLSFLVVGSAHALLIFKTASFMEARFKDYWSLSSDPLRAFLFSIGRSYLLLLLPEFLILWIAGYGQFAVIGMGSEYCMLIFYHYFSGYLQFNLKALLKSSFLLLCVAFVLTLYGFFWLVIMAYLLIGYLLFRSKYYCKG